MFLDIVNLLIVRGGKVEIYNKNADEVTVRPIVIFFCGREQCEPGHAFGPAIRPHYLLHYIVHGSGKYYENGRVHNLAQGQAFLIKPKETTFYMASQQDPWEYMWFAFGGTEAENIVDRCGMNGNSPIYQGGNGGEIAFFLQSMVENFENYNQNEFMLLGYFYLIFSRMENHEQSGKGAYEKFYMRQAVEYIKNNYSYDIRISDIAKYIGIDRTYLYRLFIQEENISPKKYVTKYRLEMAMRLLKQGDRNVTEIALSCGFKDTPSFCKHFRSNLNMTPSQYKDRFRIKYS